MNFHFYVVLYTYVFSFRMTCRIDKYNAFCIRREQVNYDSELKAREIGKNYYN